MAVETTDLYALARAADPNVAGVAVLEPGRTEEPGWHVYTVSGLRVRIDTADGSAPLAAAVTAVTAADTSDAAVAARHLARLRARAADLVSEIDEVSRAIRALVLVTKDEINLLRQWLTDFKAAVAAAATLAALKTAVAALDNLPQRTAAQARAALTGKITDAESD